MFISRYLGEVITDAEAERRGQEYDRKVTNSQLGNLTAVGNHLPLRLRLLSR